MNRPRWRPRFAGIIDQDNNVFTSIGELCQHYNLDRQGFMRKLERIYPTHEIGHGDRMRITVNKRVVEFKLYPKLPTGA